MKRDISQLLQERPDAEADARLRQAMADDAQSSERQQRLAEENSNAVLPAEALGQREQFKFRKNMFLRSRFVSQTRRPSSEGPRSPFHGAQTLVFFVECPPFTHTLLYTRYQSRGGSFREEH